MNRLTSAMKENDVFFDTGVEVQKEGREYRDVEESGLHHEIVRLVAEEVELGND